MFTTIAMHNNLTIFRPHQFQTLLSPGLKHPCYDFITDNESSYHAIKSFDCWHADRDEENERHNDNSNATNTIAATVQIYRLLVVVLTASQVYR